MTHRTQTERTAGGLVGKIAGKAKDFSARFPTITVSKET